jgi:hypothetical protein
MARQTFGAELAARAATVKRRRFTSPWKVKPRALHPILCDDIDKITTEPLRNRRGY